MRAQRISLLTALVTLFLTGCGSADSRPTPSPTPIAIPVGTTATPSAAPTSPPPSEITLWLGAAFAPAEDSPAGQLLLERLAAFEADHPGLGVEVRVKAETGAAGLLEALTTASQAAPATLPDLITLDSETLHAATLKGLIVALQGLIEPPGPPSWYPFAESAARVNGSFYGLPFAGQAEVLAYRSDVYDDPPVAWSDILSGPAPFLFPAQDPGAGFTLSLYLALGGSIYDQAGRPELEATVLEEILAFYASGRADGVIPLSARQHASASTTWPPVRDGRAQSALAPLQTFLAEYDPATDSALPFPTPDGAGTCPVNTWAFALVGDDLARQSLALELMAWLTADDFLGPWTHALSLLPATPGAMAAWPEGTAAVLVNRLVLAAVPRPSAEALATFGPVLLRAVDDVLAGQSSPEAAAQSAAAQIRVP
jgi:ABC-type glycerol-3-phosphate transport system substrate-binding protein